MKSRRSKVMIVGALVASLLLAACGGSSDSSSGTDSTAGPRPTGEPIVIGLDLDSTGPSAPFSTIAGKTIELAVQQINDEGGVLGRPLELVVENDEADPTKTPSVIKKLVQSGASFLLLSTGAGAVIQAKATLESEGVPAISPVAVTSDVAAPPNNTFSYMLANPTSDWAKVYCGAFDAANIETLGVLTDDSTSIAALSKELFGGMDGCVDIVAQESGPLNTSDLSAQVARLRSADPDAVLVASVGGAFEVLAQNTLAEQMSRVPRFSLASIGNQPSLWNLANPGALEGLVFMGSLDSTNPRTIALETFLKEKNGKDYVTVAYDANAYDAVRLVKHAIEKAGGDDPAKLNAALQEITGFEPTFGQTQFRLSFGPDKHNGSNGLCGLVLVGFGADNRPSGPWSTYQPPCG